MKNSNSKLGGLFDKFASKATAFTGSTWAFSGAVLIILVWAITGPVFNYSETWQLIINTGTTIITFLMVFLIQKTQNKDSLAIQLKLNELVAAQKGASNRLINVESLTEEDLHTLHTYHENLSEMAKKSRNIQETHSIEEAKDLNDKKENQ